MIVTENGLAFLGFMPSKEITTSFNESDVRDESCYSDEPYNYTPFLNWRHIVHGDYEGENRDASTYITMGPSQNDYNDFPDSVQGTETTLQLYAGWWFGTFGKGPAVVTVSWATEDSLVCSQQKIIFPGSQLMCPTTNVGTVNFRVTEISGSQMASFELS